MGATPERIARLRRAIADGSYAPASADVAESLLGWVVPPSAFDVPGGPDGPDRFKSPDGTAEGPLDPGAPCRDTPADTVDT